MKGEKEFGKIIQLPNVVESWENNTLEWSISCLTIIADTNEHNMLKWAKLWKPIKEI